MDLEHERRLTEVEARSSSNTKRLNELEQRQDNLDALVSSVSVLATKQEHMESDVKEIKADVKSLAAKPAKLWDGMVEKVVMLLVAAVVGFILAQVGL